MNKLPLPIIECIPKISPISMEFQKQCPGEISLIPFRPNLHGEEHTFIIFKLIRENETLIACEFLFWQIYKRNWQNSKKAFIINYITLSISD